MYVLYLPPSTRSSCERGGRGGDAWRRPCLISAGVPSHFITISAFIGAHHRSLKLPDMSTRTASSSVILFVTIIWVTIQKEMTFGLKKKSLGFRNLSLLIILVVPPSFFSHVLPCHAGSPSFPPLLKSRLLADIRFSFNNGRINAQKKRGGKKRVGQEN